MTLDPLVTYSLPLNVKVLLVELLLPPLLIFVIINNIKNKVEKYKKIYCDKIARGKTCDTIVFGEFMGDERVFLLQNMFLLLS